MAKNKNGIQLTPKMMHEAEYMCDKLRDERFKYPKICHECGSDKIWAFVPNPEYVAHELVNGQWEYRESENYDGDYLDWDNAHYRCDDCHAKFKPTNENGWKAEAIVAEKRLNG